MEEVNMEDTPVEPAQTEVIPHQDPLIPYLLYNIYPLMRENYVAVWISLLGLLVFYFFIYPSLKSSKIFNRTKEFKKERIIELEEARRVAIMRQQEQLDEQAQEKLQKEHEQKLKKLSGESKEDDSSEEEDNAPKPKAPKQFKPKPSSSNSLRSGFNPLNGSGGGGRYQFARKKPW